MVSLLEELTRHGSVRLEGYKNQVGGQFQLMKYGDCVCKPLVLRESKFYQCLSEELKSFTAAYHGDIHFKISYKFHDYFIHPFPTAVRIKLLFNALSIYATLGQAFHKHNIN